MRQKIERETKSKHPMAALPYYAQYQKSTPIWGRVCIKKMKANGNGAERPGNKGHKPYLKAKNKGRKNLRAE